MVSDPDLVVRLTVIERSLRRAHTCLALGAVCVVAAFLVAARPGQLDTVTATAFRLVDDKGTLRGSFLLEDNAHPSLAILDGEGHKRWQVLLKNDEVFTYLRDHEGHGRITNAVDHANHPHILMHDKGNKPRIHLAVADSGAPSLIFIHQDGTMPAGVGVHADGRGWLLPEPDKAGSEAKK